MSPGADDPGTYQALGKPRPESEVYSHLGDSDGPPAEYSVPHRVATARIPQSTDGPADYMALADVKRPPTKRRGAAPARGPTQYVGGSAQSANSEAGLLYAAPAPQDYDEPLAEDLPKTASRRTTAYNEPLAFDVEYAVPTVFHKRGAGAARPVYDMPLSGDTVTDGEGC